MAYGDASASVKRARVAAAAAAVVDANKGQAGADAALLAADALAAMRRRSHCPSPPPPLPPPPPPPPPPSVDTVIADNARDLIQLLPPASPHRGPLVQALTQRLSPGDAVNLGLSERATRRARREIGSFVNSPLFAASSPRENNLVSDADPERDATILWFKDEMPAPSGSPDGKPLQRATDIRVYMDYVRAHRAIVRRSFTLTGGRTITRNQRLYEQQQAIAQQRILAKQLSHQQQLPAAVLDELLSMLDPMPQLVTVHPQRLEHWKAEAHVHKRTVFDGHFDCLHCVKVHRLEKEGKPLTEELKAHVAARDAQARYRKQLRENIPEDTLVIHFDFSHYNLLPNIHDGKDSIQTVWDFIVVVEWMENGVKYHRNLHFLCDSPGPEKHDACYVAQALRMMHKQRWFAPYRRIEVFSDGCTKHFKCAYGLQVMAQLVSEWRAAAAATGDGQADVTAVWTFHGVGPWPFVGGLASRCGEKHTARSATQRAAAWNAGAEE